MQVIKLSKVFRRLNDRILGIEDISFDLTPGEIVGVLGPNGAGKTTLLKILALIMPPDEGDIYFDGVRLNGLGHKDNIRYKKQIGYLPEVPFIYSKLTGREYITFVGELYGLAKDEIQHKVNRYFEYFDLEEGKNIFLSAYSQGMLKKISIIASLMNDQPLYILDEPTSSLDPKTITALKDLLVDFRTKGRTIILSTHILDIAERLSDRIIIINKGKLVCDEPIERLQALEPEDNRTRLEKLYFEMTA